MNKILAVCLFLLTGMSAFGQEAVSNRPSPLEIVTLKYEDTYVKITYGRPHKRGRNIFGELVPYGEIWRTGANEATEITTTGRIKLAGKEVRPGTYSIFTIPREDKWTIILNKDLGQWGAYNYRESFDLMRFDVPVETTGEIWEPFTIEFEQVKNGANIIMKWDKTQVKIPLEFI
jgi:hypothetical protein